MIRLPFLDRRSLTTRLLVSFELLTLLTLLLVGLLTFHLVNSELERQVRARVAQGASASEALYAARLRESEALVQLVAERPTLERLLRERDLATLEPYLETLRAPTGLDCLVVLDVAARPLVYAPSREGCAAPGPFGDLAAARGASWHRLPAEGAAAPPALVVQEPLLDVRGVRHGGIVGWTLLDESYLAELRKETGLEHALYADGERLASTLPGMPRRLAEAQAMDGKTLYLYPFPLSEGAAPLVDLLVLPAGGIIAARERLFALLAGSTVMVGALAALLAWGLGRRISAPLGELVRASQQVGRGDLSTPIPLHPHFREVAVLSRTLERMRQRLREVHENLMLANQWHETLLASLAEGVVTVDEAGTVTSFSQGAERILGWEAREAIGRPLGALLRSHEGAGAAHAALPHIAPGTALLQTVLSREGAAVALRITGGAITPRDGQRWEQAYVMRDVTEDEQAMRLREFLLANVSHEFKTPLTALHATAELLSQELPTLAQEELRALIESVLQGTRRLEELVDNLLSSASLHTGHFAIHPRPCDLEVLIEEVLLGTQPLLALHGQSLKIDAPSPLPPVLADSRRLHQVLVNLISNASKYGPPRAPIHLAVEPAAGHLRVAVSDSGPGIPPELRGRLFQPFSRGEGNGRGGIGLGLSIVRAIVQRHGGEVGVERVPGGGATFWFTLPRARDEGAER